MVLTEIDHEPVTYRERNFGAGPVRLDYTRNVFTVYTNDLRAVMVSDCEYEWHRIDLLRQNRPACYGGAVVAKRAKFGPNRYGMACRSFSPRYFVGGTSSSATLYVLYRACALRLLCLFASSEMRKYFPTYPFFGNDSSRISFSTNPTVICSG